MTVSEMVVKYCDDPNCECGGHPAVASQKLRNDLQGVAEEVHLAIKLLDDAIRGCEGSNWVGTAVYAKKRMEAVRDVLRPVALTLAPYLPNYKEPKEEFAEQDLQDLNHETEDDPGYLSGNDEQGYSARHA